MSAPCSRPKNCGSIGVSIMAGRIALERMPSGPSLMASDIMNSTMPPFVIEYNGLNGEPTTPDTEAVKMMEPLPSAGEGAAVRGWSRRRRRAG